MVPAGSREPQRGKAAREHCKLTNTTISNLKNKKKILNNYFMEDREAEFVRKRGLRSLPLRHYMERGDTGYTRISKMLIKVLFR